MGKSVWYNLYDRYGVLKFTGTYNECRRWIIEHTTFSFEYATKWGGYQLVGRERATTQPEED